MQTRRWGDKETRRRETGETKDKRWRDGQGDGEIKRELEFAS